MKSATTVVALVLTLLVWASVASATFIRSVEFYNIATPAPDGQASCALIVGGTLPAGTAATLSMSLDVSSGEAQIPELGLGGGIQPGCDIFPEGPFGCRISAPCVKGIPVNIGEFLLEYTLQVHAHPDADCEASGLAEGNVAVVLFGSSERSGGQLVVTLVCP
jgi:hypothetical protein